MELLIAYGLPLLLANIVHQTVIIPHNLFSRLAIPIDFDIHFAGAPLFGSKKTFRGLLTVSLLTGGLAPLCAVFVSTQPAMHFLLAGLALGFVYMLGELPNSFLKRRAGLAESAHGAGILGAGFLVLNHVDSVLAATTLLYFTEDSPSIPLFFIAGTTMHIAVNLFLRHAGYKCGPLEKK